MDILSALVAVVGIASVGFIAGLYHERANWNKLIEDGRLAAPARTRARRG